jgi:hypothetical protein
MSIVEPLGKDKAHSLATRRNNMIATRSQPEILLSTELRASD